MRRKKLDLSKPIFTIYVNTEVTKEPQKYLTSVKEIFDVYSNVTFWIISSSENRVECVWDGKSGDRIEEQKRLLNEIYTKVKIFSQSKNIEEFKMNFRNWAIEEVYGNKEE
jgi:hypothetical protein